MSININSISDKRCDKCEFGVLLGINSIGQQVYGCGKEFAMDTLTMIKNLRKVAEEHKEDKLFTGQLNITAMCTEAASRLEKLKKYEDLEEQGLLLKLPCKVGDTVWELCNCNDNVYRVFPMKVTDVIAYGGIREIKGKEPVTWNIYAISDYTDMYKSFYDIGKTVFLTKEEAEEALRKMKESES